MAKMKLSEISRMALMRRKSSYPTSRAAWKAIVEKTGLKTSQVRAKHTADAWRWEINSKSASKPTKKKTAKKKPVAKKKKPAANKRTSAKKNPPTPVTKATKEKRKRGAKIIARLATEQLCPKGTLKGCKPFYKRLTDDESNDFDVCLSWLKKISK